MADYKDTENAESSRREESFKARRRLLKASAAAPLIGTLSPGAALAANSTQCDANDDSFDEAVAVDDKALRMNALYWESLPANPANDMYQVGERFYDAEHGREVAPNYTSGNGRRRAAEQRRIVGYKNGVPRAVLCYVDLPKDPYTGEVISRKVEITGFFPQQHTGGTAISDSCWDSIGGLQSLVYDQANG